MIFENPSELKDLVEWFTNRPVHGPVVVVEDTTEYMAIQRGMVLRLEGNDYCVTGDAREGRFGLNEQPKFWVKYAIDLSTGARKVIKLVFYEEFTTFLGRFTVRCTRSAEKESAVLDAVRGHPNFMQGVTVRDARKNSVRIIDLIQGTTLFSHVVDIPQSHREYFFHTFPGILRSIITSIEAIEFLSRCGLHHGDIRNDHLIIDNETGQYRWIDFDLYVNYPDYDIWSIGNILVYAAGKGIHSLQIVQADRAQYPSTASSITQEDTLLFYPYRVANLKKLFPYIPEELNDVLVRFSFGARRFYEDFSSQVNDLRRILTLLEEMAEGEASPSR